jgi:hypothetical protein
VIRCGLGAEVDALVYLYGRRDEIFCLETNDQFGDLRIGTGADGSFRPFEGRARTWGCK